jgi:hypothetical protein
MRHMILPVVLSLFTNSGTRSLPSAAATSTRIPALRKKPEGAMFGSRFTTKAFAILGSVVVGLFAALAEPALADHQYDWGTARRLLPAIRPRSRFTKSATGSDPFGTGSDMCGPRGPGRRRTPARSAPAVASGVGGRCCQPLSRRCLATWLHRSSSWGSVSERINFLASRPIVSCVSAKRIPKASGSMSGIAVSVADVPPDRSDSARRRARVKAA